jgi:hypothetical protein
MFYCGIETPTLTEILNLKCGAFKQTARERDINSPLRHSNQVKFSQWGTNFIPVVLPAAINFAGAHDVYNSPTLIIPEVLRIPTFRAFRPG